MIRTKYSPKNKSKTNWQSFLQRLCANTNLPVWLIVFYINADLFSIFKVYFFRRFSSPPSTAPEEKNMRLPIVPVVVVTDDNNEVVKVFTLKRKPDVICISTFINEKRKPRSYLHFPHEMKTLFHIWTLIKTDFK